MNAAPTGTVAEPGITPAELRLAARNHAMPLEALRHEITPPGLHYLLIHYDIPAIDPGGGGGAPQAYGRALPIGEGVHPLLAYEMTGAPPPPQHGFPLRLVVPGWYGMQNVKWLTRITVLEEPYTGFQNAVAYRMYGIDGDPGEPVTRMLPRSLTVPPGVPDFMTRTRHLTPGRTTLSGKAWSGQGPIASVQVSTDGGETWAEADLGAELGPHAWRGWTHDWDVPVGEHVISSRATDAAGNTQPLEPPWNLKGYANNAVEQIPVTVAPPS